MLAKILLSLGSALLALLVAEAGLRLTDYRYLQHPYVDFPDGYFVEDPVLGIDMAADFPPAEIIFQGPSFTSFTNELGCFDYSRDLEDDYILVLGDSTTWGYAPLEAKWTTLIEAAAGRQVLKCGVSGTGPAYQLAKARKVIRRSGKRPGMIIVLYDSDNDFNDDVVYPGYNVVRGQRVNNLKSLDLRTGVLERYSRDELERRYDDYLASITPTTAKGRVAGFLRRHSVLVTVALDIIDKSGGTGDTAPVAHGSLLESRYGFYLWDVDTDNYPWVLHALDDHVSNVMALKGLADLYAAPFILFSTYLRDDGLKGRLVQMITAELPYYMNVGEQIALTANGRRTGWRYNGHWNILGNRLAAEAMIRYLREAGLL